MKHEGGEEMIVALAALVILAIAAEVRSIYRDRKKDAEEMQRSRREMR